jgi:hypothetical protein
MLDFEDFCRCRNNFALHFAGEENEPHLMGDIYRARWAFYTAMAQDAEFLSIAAQLRGITDQDLSEVRLRQMYEAYKHMRAYAESDWELFE